MTDDRIETRLRRLAETDDSMRLFAALSSTVVLTEIDKVAKFAADRFAEVVQGARLFREGTESGDAEKRREGAVIMANALAALDAASEPQSERT